MGRGKDLNLEERISEAIQNVRDDRSIVGSLLTDLMIYMKKDQAAHKECGVIASKYVETLQRSNEQLVKISNILHRREDTSPQLSDMDKDSLFEIIKNKGGDDE